MEKQFYHLGREGGKKKSIQEHTLTTHPYIPAHTHTHIHTHTEDTKHHEQALHETSGTNKLIRLTIKLRTVHHTTEGLRSQSVDGDRPGRDESVQRTLAVKQRPGGGGGVHRRDEAAPEKTLIS